MAIKYLDANRIRGTAAERTALTTSSSAIPQTSWKELDRVTLSGTSDTMDTGTFAAKDNLMFLLHVIRSGSVSVNMTFNNDDGANYAKRLSETGESDGTSVSQDYLRISIDGEDDEFYTMSFRNIANQEKLGIIHLVARQGGTGAGNSPTRGEIVCKWANTANQITRVELDNPSGGDFAAGCELIVLGMDDDEADSGTNFWQELASPTETSGTITTTFTAKKYLWCSVHAENSGSIQPELILGDGGSIDTGNNYASRGSVNGASDWTRNGHDSIESEHATSSPIYGDCFGVNVADKEKLWIIHWIYENTGTSNAPERVETVGKWTNTSAQANTIGFKEAGSGSYTASRFRLWGSD